MSGAQAAHDDVERIGKLGCKPLLPPAAQHAQDDIRQCGRAKQRSQRALEEAAAEQYWGRESDNTGSCDNDNETRESDGDPRLQDQSVECDEAEPKIATAGEPAFAPQRNEDAFAIRAFLRQPQAPIDLAAIRRRREAQKINGLEGQPRRNRDQ